MIRRLSALALGVGLTLAASAWADPPQINGISPAGVPRGVATEVAISGQNLAGNPQLVAPFPATVETSPGSGPNDWKTKVIAAPGTGVGIYPVRVRTDDGLSNPFLLAVGQLPQVAEKEENNTFETAQAVPSPVVIEGQTPGNDVDFFRFAGKKGQRIVVDAQCARIGSGVDPTIRLTTVGRQYVASADDSPGLLTDARLTAVLPDDTDYVVEISDSRYQGGNRPVYRLVIGPVPVADEVYPLGGRRGETVGFELRGGTLPDLRVAAATLAPPPGVDSYRLQVTNQTLGLAAPTDPPLEVEATNPLAVGELPELREPADPSAPPLRAAAPVTINGRIDPAGDEDRFVVIVAPGQAYRIRVDAAELGSALDGTLQILGPTGSVLAQADDTTRPAVAKKAQQQNAPALISPDPSLSFTVPGGTPEITLALRDLEGRGGPGFPYRLTVEPINPSFQLALADSQASIPKGGTAAVALTVTRQGYNGPIALSVPNPPAGLSVRSGTIADGQVVGVLSLSASADAAFGATELKVVGTGQGPKGPIEVAASKLVIFAQQANFPTNSQEQGVLAVAPASTRPISLETPTGPVEVVHGYGAPISVKATRGPGGESALDLTPLPLPPGLAVPAAKLAEKANEGIVTVNVAPETPLGAMTIGLTAKTKIGGKDQVLSAPAVTLMVVRPADLELAANSLEVKAGADVELKGKVVRKGPFKEPVTVKVNGLPAGLKAEPATVAPDAADFTLKLVAEPSAAPATANVQVALAFQINKKDYPTPPATLALKVVK
jgi:hypothetical protein